MWMSLYLLYLSFEWDPRKTKYEVCQPFFQFFFTPFIFLLVFIFVFHHSISHICDVWTHQKWSLNSVSSISFPDSLPVSHFCWFILPVSLPFQRNNIKPYPGTHFGSSLLTPRSPFNEVPATASVPLVKEMALRPLFWTNGSRTWGR